VGGDPNKRDNDREIFAWRQENDHRGEYADESALQYKKRANFVREGPTGREGLLSGSGKSGEPCMVGRPEGGQKAL